MRIVPAFLIALLSLMTLFWVEASAAAPAAPSRPQAELAADAIEVDGTISSNTTWTTGNVYVVDSVTVRENVVLTIQPGTIIKFESEGELRVSGTLLAEGTAQAPIIFTSFRDDSVGGDTNGDGSATTAIAGDWRGMYFLSSGVGRFQYVQAGYGGRFYDAIISSIGDNLFLDNVTLHDSSALGLQVGSNVRQLTVQKVNFAANAQTAALISVSSLLSFTLAGNICNDNGIDGLRIVGNFNNPFVLGNPGCPLIPSFSELATAPEIRRTLTLAPGTIFKMDSGIRVTGTLIAEGTAVAPIIFTSLRNGDIAGDTNGDGAATSPAPGDWRSVLFLSGSVGRLQHVQMSYGGDDGAMLSVFADAFDLNNVTINESSGDGLRTNGTRNVRITNAVFHTNKGDGLEVGSVASGGDFVIQNSRFEASGGYGLNKTAGGRLTVACVEVTSNETGGIQINSGFVPDGIRLLRSSVTNNLGNGLNWQSSSRQIEAPNLWWGNASGPGGAGPGTGNAVSANVRFQPWLTVVPECAGNVDLQRPYLQVSYPTGMPGSVLTVRGFNFPANAEVNISVNGRELGTVPSDGEGAFIFVFNTTNATPGLYTATAAAARATTTLAQEPIEASVAFNLLEDALERQRDEDASDVPALAIPAGLVSSGNMVYLPLVRR